MSRFLTILVQLMLLGVTVSLVRMLIQDVKENGF
jgi:hypothetical protein